MRILFLGDIDDIPGLEAIKVLLPDMKKELRPNFIIVNGENAAKGLGIDKESYDIITNLGVDIITLGNHTWSNREVYSLMEDEDTRLLRPVNFPEDNPGQGLRIVEKDGKKLAVLVFHGQESIINILGKEIFSHNMNPFIAADEILEDFDDEIKCIFVEFHAESTIEKMAFGNYLDSRVSAVVGTHTHVATSDEKILSGGTAYITDVGMTGAADSIAGVDAEMVIKQYLTMKPTMWKGAVGEPEINAVVVDIDEKTGKAYDIFRLKRRLTGNVIQISAEPRLFTKFLGNVVRLDSLNSVARYLMSYLQKKTNIKNIAFIERDCYQTIARYSSIEPEALEKIKEELHTDPETGKRFFKDYFIMTYRDIENPELYYSIVFKTNRKVKFDKMLIEIFRSLYSKLRKEKLLIQTNDELSILYEVGKEIATTIELHGEDGLINKIMEATTKVMNCESSSVMMIDERTQELYFIVGIGEKGDKIKEVRLKKGQGIAGWVVETGRAAVVPDTSKDKRFFKDADDHTKYNTRSLIAVPLKSKGKVIGVLEVLNRKGEILFNEHDLYMLEAIAQQAANAIDNAKLYERIKFLYRSTVEVLANAMDSKDAYTHGHSRRVAAYTVDIATEMGMNPVQVSDLEIAALLHDIGKIGIRDSILCKPGRLTHDEYDIIKTHPVISGKILEPVDFLKSLIPVIRHHHERFDGAGYPDNLSGDKIPLGARIIAVADTFDAMTSDRAYRKGLPPDVAKQELLDNSGTQFDPNIVQIFIDIFDRKYKDNFEEIKSKFASQEKILKDFLGQ